MKTSCSVWGRWRIPGGNGACAIRLVPECVQPSQCRRPGTRQSPDWTCQRPQRAGCWCHVMSAPLLQRNGSARQLCGSDQFEPPGTTWRMEATAQWDTEAETVLWWRYVTEALFFSACIIKTSLWTWASDSNIRSTNATVLPCPIEIYNSRYHYEQLWACLRCIIQIKSCTHILYYLFVSYG